MSCAQFLDCVLRSVSDCMGGMNCSCVLVSPQVSSLFLCAVAPQL